MTLKMVPSKPSALSLMLSEPPEIEADRGLIAFSAMFGDTPVKCHMHRHDAAVFARRILKMFEAMQGEQAEVLEMKAAPEETGRP